MDDQTGPRLLLGVEHSDIPSASDNIWTLAFYPNRARIGMYTETKGGKTHLRGSLKIHDDPLEFPEPSSK